MGEWVIWTLWCVCVTCVYVWHADPLTVPLSSIRKQSLISTTAHLLRHVYSHAGVEHEHAHKHTHTGVYCIFNTQQVLLCHLRFALHKDTNSRLTQTLKPLWKGLFLVLSLPLLNFLFLLSPPWKGIVTLLPSAAESKKRETSVKTVSSYSIKSFNQISLPSWIYALFLQHGYGKVS